MNLLELHHLKKYYATHKAVDDISFNIPHSSIFGLLGPNGAGKTTLLRMVTGIFYPDEGEILFDGKKFDASQHISKIGYMPEERGLYKKMKVGEQVLYLAQLKGLSENEAKEKVRYWFKKMDIAGWWDKKIADLSKGMSQKVQFISTIMHGPKLLILDEPFSGLDPINANMIKDEIFELSKQGTTIIFSTHRMEQVEEICDRIVLIDKGKKLLDGDIKQVKQDFKQHLFKVELDETLDGKAIQADGFSIVQKNEDSLIIKLHDEKTTNQLLSDLIRQNLSIKSFHEILPTLNEIFIAQVQKTEIVSPQLAEA